MIRAVRGGVRRLSTFVPSVYAPSPEHAELRALARRFCEEEVEPQSLEFNRDEKFNRPLFEKVAALGLVRERTRENAGGG